MQQLLGCVIRKGLNMMAAMLDNVYELTPKSFRDSSLLWAKSSHLLVDLAHCLIAAC